MIPPMAFDVESNINIRHRQKLQIDRSLRYIALSCEAFKNEIISMMSHAQ